MTQKEHVHYVVITPVRDEAEHIAETIRSMVNQTVKPVQWVIVDDGSTDETGNIIGKYAVEYSWIRVLHRVNRGRRENGAGVIEAFYSGYESLTVAEWDFIVKLDGDVSASADYFEGCFREFEKDGRLGIGGGAPKLSA